MEIKIKVFSTVFVFLLILSIGTVAYMNLEKWDWVDSLYFTTTTLTTIGFGDLHPTTSASKLFTVFFVILGVSFVLFSLTLFADVYFKHGHSVVEGRIRDATRKIGEKRRPWRR